MQATIAIPTFYFYANSGGILSNNTFLTPPTYFTLSLILSSLSYLKYPPLFWKIFISSNTLISNSKLKTLSFPQSKSKQLNKFAYVMQRLKSWEWIIIARASQYPSNYCWEWKRPSHSTWQVESILEIEGLNINYWHDYFFSRIVPHTLHIELE